MSLCGETAKYHYLEDHRDGPGLIGLDVAQQPFIEPIPRSRKLERIQENLCATDTDLTEEEARPLALGGPDGTTLFVVAAEWRGMTEPEPVSPGTGQVLTIQVDVPAAGWP